MASLDHQTFVVAKRVTKLKKMCQPIHFSIFIGESTSYKGLKLDKYSDMDKNIQKGIETSEPMDCFIPKVDQSTEIVIIFFNEVYWLWTPLNQIEVANNEFNSQIISPTSITKEIVKLVISMD